MLDKRHYLFKGKAKDWQDRWIYGSLVYAMYKGKCYIHPIDIDKERILVTLAMS